jgi:pyrroloquinoline quinone (PQQ) biosynthesis protein C
MTRTAEDLLDHARRELAPAAGANRLVPLVAEGRAPRSVIAALAAEQRHIIASDWRSFLELAARADDPAARGYFAGLAAGEGVALGHVERLAAAAGMSADELAAYEPAPGCQAYPAFQAWLALNAHPGDVVLALAANFTTWGGYCAALAGALRAEYGFDDAACAFFDLFAAPAPDAEAAATAVIQAALDTGRDGAAGLSYGRRMQAYELMFWNTLAERAR